MENKWKWLFLVLIVIAILTGSYFIEVEGKPLYQYLLSRFRRKDNVDPE